MSRAPLDPKRPEAERVSALVPPETMTRLEEIARRLGAVHPSGGPNLSAALRYAVSAAPLPKKGKG